MNKDIKLNSIEEAIEEIDGDDDDDEINDLFG